MIENKWENKQMPKAFIENKSQVRIHGLKPGAKLEIDVDDKNVPKDQQWRRRLKDAKVDECVELIKTKKKKGE